MPYIPQEQREIYLPSLTMIPAAETSGQLNYQITYLINEFLADPEPPYTRQSYAKYNEAIGVLECAKLELYRRRISAYENDKCEEHGDVY